MLKLLRKLNFFKLATLIVVSSQSYVCYRIILIVYNIEMNLRFCLQILFCLLASSASPSRFLSLNSSLE